MAKSKRRQQETAVSFTEQIRAALNHLDEPQWLGENSPLSSPYFLGQAIVGQKNEFNTPEHRGRILIHLLHSAAEQLWQDEPPHDKTTLNDDVAVARQNHGHKGGKYHFYLLELRYFRRFFRAGERPYSNNDLELSDFLGISRASYFNHLKMAHQQLGEALLRILQPTFRLEQPPEQSVSLVGRNRLVGVVFAHLKNGRSVTLSGASGVGKTALGSVISQEWQPSPVFWFTFRDSFNDRLSSLLFSLGYFLHKHGASALWKQLVADNGKIEDFNIALAHIRGSQEAISKPILICIDEVDILQTDPDQATVSQTQLLTFIESLQTIFPTLLMGQKPLLLTELHEELTNFSTQEATLFLEQAAVQLSVTDREALHLYTGGNPRLLRLCLALFKSSMPIDSIVERIPQTPAVQALWHKLWQRFSQDERQILASLSVFRSAAPRDVWLDKEAALNQLAQWQLILQDGFEGLSLLPTIKDLIYADRKRFPAEIREACHLAAADVRAKHGDYTSSAYHYFQAGYFEQMVQLWYPNRQFEIQRGQGAIALTIFEQLSPTTLPQEEQQALALLLAELYRLVGDAEQGLSALKAIKWPASSESTAQAHLLRGEFLNALGQPYRALDEYDDGVAVVSRLLSRLIDHRSQKVTVLIQQREMNAASLEANLAQYDALYLQGFLDEENGRLQSAKEKYSQALDLAGENQYAFGLAQAHRSISKIYGRLANVAKAQHHAEAAINHYRKIGDRLTEEKVRSTLAATHLQAGNFQEVIAAATISCSFFADAQIPYWEAVTASSLAEAYYEVGDFENAKITAHRVLALEEGYTLPYAYFTLGLVSQAQNELKLAEKQFQLSQQIASENEDYFMAAYAWRSLAEAYIIQRHHEQGKEALSTALTLFEKLGLEQELQKTKEIAHQHFGETPDFSESLSSN